MDKHVIVIGGGLGGLFTGAILAKEGCKVQILEKNRTIGGGLQSFSRRGTFFDTGMHILGGLREGGNVYRICKYLGISDKMAIHDNDHDCIDSITYLSDKTEIKVPEGKDAFINYFSKLFPHEKEGIRAYVNQLYNIANEVDLFCLRETKELFKQYSEEFFLPADELIAKYIQDSKLRDMLGYMNPMYGGMAGHSPAYIHAVINVLYISGSSHFVGDSQQMADALKDVIVESGGQVLTDKEVVRVATENKQVLFVETKDGCLYKADYYVSDIHPYHLFKICDSGSFPKSYRDRIEGLPSTFSSFSLYIILKKDTFPYINHTCYIQDDYGMVWDYNSYSSDWPRGLMYVTPEDENQGAYASRLIINCPMPFSAVDKWKDSVMGKRPKEYIEWKDEMKDRILDKISVCHPQIRSCISDIYTSSPLTIRDYYNTRDGSLYGIRKDSNDIASQVTVATKVKNLYLTGQNVNLHGICGVPLTAIMTSEAIVGHNVVLEKINKA